MCEKDRLYETNSDIQSTSDDLFYLYSDKRVKELKILYDGYFDWVDDTE